MMDLNLERKYLCFLCEVEKQDHRRSQQRLVMSFSGEYLSQAWFGVWDLDITAEEHVSAPLLQSTQ